MLMVIGHTDFFAPWGGLISKSIFSFHMPLFFIIAGLFVRKVPFNFNKEVRFLILPYLITEFFLVILKTLRSHFICHSLNINSVISALYGNGAAKTLWGVTIPDNSPLWFLLALFFSKLLYQNVVLKSKYDDLCVLLISITGYIIGEFVMWLPFSLCPAMVSVIFMHIGYRYKNYRYSVSPFFLICCLLLWVSGLFFDEFSLESNTFPLLFVSIIIAVSGTWLMFWISNIKTIRSRILLQYFGNISMLVLCVHTLESQIQPWGHLYRIIELNDPIMSFLWSFICAILRLFVTLTITYYMSKIGIIRKYFIR